MTAPRRLLVVAEAPVDDAVLREDVLARAGGAGAEVRVVAPASDLSPLRWLASDEDAARGEAEEVAAETGAALGAEAEVGDADPLQAIEDALRTFAADELVVITRPESEASWLEQGSAEEALARFGLPVTHLVHPR